MTVGWCVAIPRYFNRYSEQVSIELSGYGSSELAAGRVFDQLGRLGSGTVDQLRKARDYIHVRTRS